MKRIAGKRRRKTPLKRRENKEDMISLQAETMREVLKRIDLALDLIISIKKSINVSTESDLLTVIE